MIRLFFQITAWLLIGAIVWLSLVPPTLRPVTNAPHNMEHLAIFLLAGICVGIGYPSRFALRAVMLIGFAGLIEIAQLLALGRHARLSDFIVDGLAAAAGVGLAWLSTKAPTIRDLTTSK